MAFGQRLAQLLKDRNFSQADLAEKVGVAQTAVSKWTRGTAVPGFDVACEVAKVFGVSVAFFADEPPGSSGPRSIQVTLTLTDANGARHELVTYDPTTLPR